MKGFCINWNSCSANSIFTINKTNASHLLFLPKERLLLGAHWNDALDGHSIEAWSVGAAGAASNVKLESRCGRVGLDEPVAINCWTVHKGDALVFDSHTDDLVLMKYVLHLTYLFK